MNEIIPTIDETPLIVVPAGQTIYRPDEHPSPDGIRPPGECPRVVYQHTVKVIPTAASHRVRDGKVMVTWGREGARRCTFVDLATAISASAPGWG